jgi:hypothetical protein
MAVPPRLQPAVELAVVEHEDTGAVRGDHDGAPGQVALGDPAIEGIGMAEDEIEDPFPIAGLLLVPGDVATEGLGESGEGCVEGHLLLKF